MAPSPSYFLSVLLVCTAYQHSDTAVIVVQPLAPRVARELAMGSSVRDRDSNPPRNVAFFLAHLPSHDQFKSVGKNCFPVYEEFPVQDTLQACGNDGGNNRISIKNPYMNVSDSNPVSNDADFNPSGTYSGYESGSGSNGYASSNSNGAGTGYGYGRTYDNGGQRCCKPTLEKNLDCLINWARKTNGMATGVVSTLNSTDDQFRGRMKRERERERERERSGTASVTGTPCFQGEKSRAQVASTGGSSNVNQNGGNDLDPANEMFQTANRMRQMFMGSFMQSLGFPPTNQRGYNGDFYGRGDNDVRPPLRCLVQSTLNNLRGASDCTGFLLVVKAEGRVDPLDLDNSVRLIIDQTNPTDTLIVVASLCPDNGRNSFERPCPLKVYAKGPNCYVIRNCRSLCDLPVVVKEAIRHRDTISTADDDKFRGLSPDSENNSITRYREGNNVTGSSARFPVSSYGTSSDDRLDNVNNKFGDNQPAYSKSQPFNKEGEERQIYGLNGRQEQSKAGDHRVKELPEHYHHAMYTSHPRDMDQQSAPKDKSRAKIMRLFEDLLNDLRKHESNIDAVLREQAEEASKQRYEDNSTVSELSSPHTTKSCSFKFGDTGLENNLPLSDPDPGNRNNMSFGKNTYNLDNPNRYAMSSVRPHSSDVKYPLKKDMEEKIAPDRASTNSDVNSSGLKYSPYKKLGSSENYEIHNTSRDQRGIRFLGDRGDEEAMMERNDDHKSENQSSPVLSLISEKILVAQPMKYDHIRQLDILQNTAMFQGETGDSSTTRTKEANDAENSVASNTSAGDMDIMHVLDSRS